MLMWLAKRVEALLGGVPHRQLLFRLLVHSVAAKPYPVGEALMQLQVLACVCMPLKGHVYAGHDTVWC